MIKRIILAKNVKHNFESIIELNEDEDELPDYYKDDYVQLSGIVEVDFPEIAQESVVQGQIDILDKQITKVQADAQAAITALTGRKQELLAIGYEGERE